MHLLFQMRSRLKSWCQSTTTTSSGGCCLASCCSGLFRNDKERGIRHLDSRQSFYTGLSQGGPGGSIGSTPGCGYPQLTNTAKKSRTLGGGPNGLLTSGLSGNNFANTTSRVRIIYLLLLSRFSSFYSWKKDQKLLFFLYLVLQFLYLLINSILLWVFSSAALSCTLTR